MPVLNQEVEPLIDRVSNWGSLSRLSTVFSFRTFYVLLLMLTGLMVILFLVGTKRYLPVTGENVYPESAGVLVAQRWAHSAPLYEDYRQPPYLVTAFPPLWYALLAGGAKVGFSSLDSLTFFGRILTLISLLGVAALGYLWNRRLGFSSTLAVLAPAFYLSFPILIPWAVTARPDFPALFLCFLAIYWAGFEPKGMSTTVAAVCAALGFLMRHNAVAAPVAIVLWLVKARRWKHAIAFCALWASVVGLTLLPFERASHELVQLNLSSAKFGPFAFTYVRDVLNRLLEAPGQGFVVALFALGALGFLESWKQRDERSSLLNLYLVASLGFAIMGSAAAGAGVNHYLEPALAMAVLIPTGMARLREGWKNESPFAPFAVLIMAVLLVPSLDSQRSNLKHNPPEDLRRVLPLMENKQVFTDIPYLAARTSTPQLPDLASLINTERKGGWTSWSSARLTENLEGKKYNLVILVKPVFEWPYNPVADYPRWPRMDAEMQRAIGQNYQFCFELDASYVYAPFSAHSSSVSNQCPALERTPAAEKYTQVRH